MPKRTKVDLTTVAKGAVPEMFQRCLGEVLENIHDPNTDPEKVRKITVQVSFKPDQHRELIATSAQVTSTLVPIKPATDFMWLGQDRDGQLVGSTVDPRQLDLYEEDDDPSILPIDSKKETSA